MNIKNLEEGLLSKEETKTISEYLPSGITLIDLVMGGGAGMGFKRKVFHRISGIKGAGKTFLVTAIAALAKKQYGDKSKIGIQDCEGRNTIDTEYLYGVPREDLISDEPPRSVEELDAHLGSFLNSVKGKQLGIYAIDSLESLTNADIEEREEKRIKDFDAGKDVTNAGTMGMQTAKFFSQEFFRTKKNTLIDTDSTCFLLSQMRENVDKKNPYSPKYKTTGGASIEHWCDSACELTVVRFIGQKERPIGAVVELKTTKLTAPRPFRSCRYTMYFTLGIDNIGSNIDFLFDLRGKDGDLLSCAEEIVWDGKPYNKSLLVDWLEAEGSTSGIDLETEVKKAFKEKEGKTAINIDFAKTYFRNHENEAVKASFCEKFGEGESKIYTRSELIALVEADPAMESELETRVIDKWEALEAEASSEISGRRRG